MSSSAQAAGSSWPEDPLASVWDYDLDSANDFIGRVQLSGRASGQRQRHWSECLGHSDRRLELWHPLDGSAPLQLSDQLGTWPGPAHCSSPPRPTRLPECQSRNKPLQRRLNKLLSWPITAQGKLDPALLTLLS
uniref:Uncharacterized protein n=1 Tax=Pipistrellus kuhlii TaxID=59472 RepID=A0A7J7RZP4_PIPKU|nr:hypothetical protein mPipKuh1_010215 [Pipistrellus kuhlii]